MTTSLQTVRRLTIEGRTTGVKEATDQLSALSRAQTTVAQTADGMAISTESSSRRQISAARSYDAVRAKVDDAYRSQQQYQRMQATVDRALNQGVIEQQEYAKTSAMLSERFKVNSNSANDNAKAIGLARHEMVNLGRQAQDVGTMLAMGTSPMQVFTSQAAQVFDIFSSSQGTMKGFFGQVTSGLSSIITPARLAFGGIIAGAGAAYLAVTQYAEAQRQVQMSLVGMGRASGASVGSINAVASQGSSAFGLSVSEAREMASALAATGRVANDNLLPIVKIGKDISKVFGIEATEASRLLAQSFADPARGAEQLNQRLGFMDAAMQRNIQNLVAQNRMHDAQRALLDGVTSSLDGLNRGVASSSKFWTALGNTISNVWDKTGEFLSRSTGIGYTAGLDEQIENTKQRIAELEALMSRRSEAANRGLGTTTALARERAELERLTGEWQKYWQSVQDAVQRRDSFAQRQMVTAVLPEIETLSRLQNQHLGLAMSMDAVNRSGGTASPLLRAMGISYEQLVKSLNEAKGAVGGFKSENDRAMASLQLQIGQVGRKGPTAAGNFARDQTLLSLNSNSPDAQAQANLASTLAIRQFNQQIAEAQQQQALAATQRTEQYRLELDLVGKSAAEQERMRGVLQARQQLEQQALQTYGSRDAYDKRHLESLESEIAKQTQLRQTEQERTAMNRARFEQQTALMSPNEQNVAGQMFNLYGNNWQSQMDGAYASQLRLTNSLREYAEVGRSTFTSVGQAMRDGKITSQEWSSILDNLSSRLMDLAMNSAWDALVGGRRGGGGGGGIFGMLGGLFGSGSQMVDGYNVASTGGINPFPTPFANGGYTGPGHRLQPAGIVHAGEFVFDAASTARAGVQNLYAMQSALRGYEPGGYVTPAFGPAWTPPHANNNGGPISVQVINNGTPVDVVDQQETVDGRGNRRIQLTLDDQIASAVNTAGSATRKAMSYKLGARASSVKR
jgi:lambda family phage tail tape measure protein